MTNEAQTDNIKPSCSYCGQPMEVPVQRRIIDRGYDNLRQRQYVRERYMNFCSDKCGSNYQMGCEG